MLWLFITHWTSSFQISSFEFFKKRLPQVSRAHWVSTLASRKLENEDLGPRINSLKELVINSMYHQLGKGSQENSESPMAWSWEQELQLQTVTGSFLPEELTCRPLRAFMHSLKHQCDGKCLFGDRELLQPPWTRSKVQSFHCELTS